MSQSITLEIPEALYEQLRLRASAANRTVEAEVVEVVSSVVPVAGEIPPDLAYLLDRMRFLDDAGLQRTAKSRLSKKALSRLQSLNNKRQRDGLSEAETLTANELLRQYERAILFRAQALALLKERGFDLAPFLIAV